MTLQTGEYRLNATLPQISKSVHSAVTKNIPSPGFTIRDWSIRRKNFASVRRYPFRSTQMTAGSSSRHWRASMQLWRGHWKHCRKTDNPYIINGKSMIGWIRSEKWAMSRVFKEIELRGNCNIFEIICLSLHGVV